MPDEHEEGPDQGDTGSNRPTEQDQRDSASRGAHLRGMVGVMVEVAAESPDPSTALGRAMEAIGPKPTDPDEYQIWIAAGKRLFFDHVKADTQAKAQPEAAHEPRTYALTDFLAIDFPPVVDLVDGLVPEGSLIGVVAPPKNLKTTFTRQMALSVASGVAFFGREVPRPVSTLFIDEEGAPPQHQLATHTMMSTGLGLHPVARDLHVAYRQGFEIHSKTGIARLYAAQEATRAELVILGPLSQVGGLEDENSNAEMGALMHTLNRFVQDTGTTTVIVHHARERSAHADAPRTAGEFMGSIRGASAFHGAFDVGLGLLRTSDDSGYLYVENRYAQDGRYPFSFDPTTRLIWPAERAAAPQIKVPPREALEILAGLGEAPLATFEAEAQVGTNLARSRLQDLEHRGLVAVRSAGGNSKLYSVSASGHALLRGEEED